MASEHWFVTDLGDVKLTPNFVAEAEARWPGSKSWEVWNEEEEGWEHFTKPNWERQVRRAMDEEVLRSAIQVVDKLADIGL
jgi:hypothetical protein